MGAAAITRCLLYVLLYSSRVCAIITPPYYERRAMFMPARRHAAMRRAMRAASAFYDASA